MARSVFVKAKNTKVRPPPGNQAENGVKANVFIVTPLRRSCAVPVNQICLLLSKTNFCICAPSY